MAEDSTRENEDRRIRSQTAVRETHTGTLTASPSDVAPLGFVPQLLISAALMQGPNQHTREATMQGAQRTVGNHSVQRYLSVQRCGDTPCGCPAEEQARHKLQHQLEALGNTPVARKVDQWAMVQPSLAVQRNFIPVIPPPDPFRPAPSQATGTDARHPSGDAWWGPNHPSLDVPDAPRIGPDFMSRALGGISSYGCYCGSGGPSGEHGSRCGPNAPAVDAIDEQCRQHDLNYESRNIDSQPVPGKHNMFSSLEGWLYAEDADRQLANSVDREMRANPGNFTPSARLYGQGIKGIFGGRANVSHAMNWGLQKGHEAEVGLTQAYEDVTNWGSATYGEAERGVTGAYKDASTWGAAKYGEAERGISGFLSSASGWSSVGDVVSGLSGGASDASNWLGKAGTEALGGVTGAVGSAANWLGKTGSTALGSAGRALGSAGSWLGDTALSAVTGAGEAAAGLSTWGLETAGAVADVGVDLAGRAGRAMGHKALDAWNTVSSWF